jgi:cell division protein FtsB
MPFINGLLFPFFDFVAKNRWAQIVLGLGIGWVIFIIYLSMRDSGVRRVEREKQAAREAKEREKLVNTVNQIEQETEDAKDRALAAPDAVSDVSSVDELRERYPDNAAVILRTRETGGSGGSR